jgi:hypothetical protein
MESVKPNVFIVGVPKSGKVSLRYWLSQHPDVYANLYDTDFFSVDVEGRQDRVNSVEKYLSYFKDGRGKKVVLDQVSRSATSRVAHKFIKKFNSKAKIIINLRNPAEQMFSWHKTLQRIGFETESNFYKAIGLEEKRRRKSKSKLIKNYYYMEFADYYPQVKRFFDTFGKENVKVLLLDDLRDHPKKIYDELIKFLGLRKFDADLSVQHETKVEPKNQFYVKVLNLFLNLPLPLRLGIKYLIPPEFVEFIRSKTIREFKEKEKISPDIRAKINKSFEPNLKKLEKLIERDLRIWYDPK